MDAVRAVWLQATLNVAPTPAEGEEMFAVAHIYASFNDTFVVRFLAGAASPRVCLLHCCYACFVVVAVL